MKFIGRLVLSVAAVSIAGVGCKEIQNLQDMHDTTGKMADTTSKMSDTTAQMNDKMGVTNDNLLVSVNGIKITRAHMDQGVSKQVRHDAIMDMEKATDIETKLTHAVVFVSALQFNLYNPELDKPEDRVRLYDDAVTEYIRVAANYIRDFNEVAPDSNDDHMKNLYALAAAMHRTNPIQDEDAVEKQYNVVSVYDLVKDGFRLRKKELDKELTRSDIESATPYLRDINREIPKYLYMLRVRHNFLAAMPLAEMSKLTAGGFEGLKAKGLAFFFSWDAKQIADMGPWALLYSIDKMDYARNTRDFLREMGEDEKADGRLKRIYSHMKLHAGEATGVGTPGLGDELMQTFLDSLDKWLDNGSTHASVLSSDDAAAD